MCIGFKKDNLSFPNIDEEIFKEYKIKQKILSTEATMREEVICWSRLLDPKKVADRPNGTKESV